MAPAKSNPRKRASRRTKQDHDADSDDSEVVVKHVKRHREANHQNVLYSEEEFMKHLRDEHGSAIDADFDRFLVDTVENPNLKPGTSAKNGPFIDSTQISKLSKTSIMCRPRGPWEMNDVDEITMYALLKSHQRLPQIPGYSRYRHKDFTHALNDGGILFEYMFVDLVKYLTELRGESYIYRLPYKAWCADPTIAAGLLRCFCHVGRNFDDVTIISMLAFLLEEVHQSWEDNDEMKNKMVFNWPGYEAENGIYYFHVDSYLNVAAYVVLKTDGDKFTITIEKNTRTEEKVKQAPFKIEDAHKIINVLDCPQVCMGFLKQAVMNEEWDDWVVLAHEEKLKYPTHHCPQCSNKIGTWEMTSKELRSENIDTPWKCFGCEDKDAKFATLAMLARWMKILMSTFSKKQKELEKKLLSSRIPTTATLVEVVMEKNEPSTSTSSDSQPKDTANPSTADQTATPSTSSPAGLKFTSAQGSPMGENPGPSASSEQEPEKRPRRGRRSARVPEAVENVRATTTRRRAAVLVEKVSARGESETSEATEQVSAVEVSTTGRSSSAPKPNDMYGAELAQHVNTAMVLSENQKISGEGSRRGRRRTNDSARVTERSRTRSSTRTLRESRAATPYPDCQGLQKESESSSSSLAKDNVTVDTGMKDTLENNALHEKEEDSSETPGASIPISKIFENKNEDHNKERVSAEKNKSPSRASPDVSNDSDVDKPEEEPMDVSPLLEAHADVTDEPENGQFETPPTVIPADYDHAGEQFEAADKPSLVDPSIGTAAIPASAPSDSSVPQPAEKKLPVSDVDEDGTKILAKEPSLMDHDSCEDPAPIQKSDEDAMDASPLHSIESHADTSGEHVKRHSETPPNVVPSDVQEVLESVNETPSPVEPQAVQNELKSGESLVEDGQSGNKQILSDDQVDDTGRHEDKSTVSKEAGPENNDSREDLGSDGSSPEKSPDAVQENDEQMETDENESVVSDKENGADEEEEENVYNPMDIDVAPTPAEMFPIVGHNETWTNEMVEDLEDLISRVNEGQNLKNGEGESVSTPPEAEMEAGNNSQGTVPREIEEEEESANSPMDIEVTPAQDVASNQIAENVTEFQHVDDVSNIQLADIIKKEPVQNPINEKSPVDHLTVDHSLENASEIQSADIIEKKSVETSIGSEPAQTLISNEQVKDVTSFEQLIAAIGSEQTANSVEIQSIQTATGVSAVEENNVGDAFGSQKPEKASENPSVGDVPLAETATGVQAAQSASTIQPVEDTIEKYPAQNLIQTVHAEDVASFEQFFAEIKSEPAANLTEIQSIETTNGVPPAEENNGLESVGDAIGDALGSQKPEIASETPSVGDVPLAENVTVQPTEDVSTIQSVEDTTEEEPATTPTGNEPADDTVERNLARTSTGDKSAEDPIGDLPTGKEETSITTEAKDDTQVLAVQEANELQSAGNTIEEEPTTTPTSNEPSDDTVERNLAKTSTGDKSAEDPIGDLPTGKEETSIPAKAQDVDEGQAVRNGNGLQPAIDTLGEESANTVKSKLPETPIGDKPSDDPIEDLLIRDLTGKKQTSIAAGEITENLAVENVSELQPANDTLGKEPATSFTGNEPADATVENEPSEIPFGPQTAADGARDFLNQDFSEDDPTAIGHEAEGNYQHLAIEDIYRLLDLSSDDEDEDANKLQPADDNIGIKSVCDASSPISLLENNPAEDQIDNFPIKNLSGSKETAITGEAGKVTKDLAVKSANRLQPADHVIGAEPMDISEESSPTPDFFEKREAENITENLAVEDANKLQPADDVIGAKPTEISDGCSPAHNLSERKPVEDQIGRFPTQNPSREDPTAIVNDSEVKNSNELKPAEDVIGTKPTEISVASLPVSFLEKKPAEDPIGNLPTCEVSGEEQTAIANDSKVVSEDLAVKNANGLRPTEDVIGTEPTEISTPSLPPSPVEKEPVKEQIKNLPTCKVSGEEQTAIANDSDVVFEDLAVKNANGLQPAEDAIGTKPSEISDATSPPSLLEKEQTEDPIGNLSICKVSGKDPISIGYDTEVATEDLAVKDANGLKPAEDVIHISRKDPGESIQVTPTPSANQIPHAGDISGFQSVDSAKEILSAPDLAGKPKTTATSSQKDKPIEITKEDAGKINSKETSPAQDVFESSKTTSTSSQKGSTFDNKTAANFSGSLPVQEASALHSTNRTIQKKQREISILRKDTELIQAPLAQCATQVAPAGDILGCQSVDSAKEKSPAQDPFGKPKTTATFSQKDTVIDNKTATNSSGSHPVQDALHSMKYQQQPSEISILKKDTELIQAPLAQSANQVPPARDDLNFQFVDSAKGKSLAQDLPRKPKTTATSSQKDTVIDNKTAANSSEIESQPVAESRSETNANGARKRSAEDTNGSQFANGANVITPTEDSSGNQQAKKAKNASEVVAPGRQLPKQPYTLDTEEAVYLRYLNEDLPTTREETLERIEERIKMGDELCNSSKIPVQTTVDDEKAKLKSVESELFEKAKSLDPHNDSEFARMEERFQMECDGSLKRLQQQRDEFEKRYTAIWNFSFEENNEPNGIVMNAVFERNYMEMPDEPIQIILENAMKFVRQAAGRFHNRMELAKSFAPPQKKHSDNPEHVNASQISPPKIVPVARNSAELQNINLDIRNFVETVLREEHGSDQQSSSSANEISGSWNSSSDHASKSKKRRGNRQSDEVDGEPTSKRTQSPRLFSTDQPMHQVIKDRLAEIGRVPDQDQEQPQRNSTSPGLSDLEDLVLDWDPVQTNEATQQFGLQSNEGTSSDQQQQQSQWGENVQMPNMVHPHIQQWQGIGDAMNTNQSQFNNGQGPSSATSASALANDGQHLHQQQNENIFTQPTLSGVPLASNVAEIGSSQKTVLPSQGHQHLQQSMQLAEAGSSSIIPHHGQNQNLQHAENQSPPAVQPWSVAPQGPPSQQGEQQYPMHFPEAGPSSNLAINGQQLNSQQNQNLFTQQSPSVVLPASNGAQDGSPQKIVLPSQDYQHLQNPMQLGEAGSSSIIPNHGQNQNLQHAENQSPPGVQPWSFAPQGPPSQQGQQQYPMHFPEAGASSNLAHHGQHLHQQHKQHLLTQPLPSVVLPVSNGSQNGSLQKIVSPPQGHQHLQQFMQTTGAASSLNLANHGQHLNLQQAQNQSPPRVQQWNHVNQGALSQQGQHQNPMHFPEAGASSNLAINGRQLNSQQNQNHLTRQTLSGVPLASNDAQNGSPQKTVSPPQGQQHLQYHMHSTAAPSSNLAHNGQHINLQQAQNQSPPGAQPWNLVNQGPNSIQHPMHFPEAGPSSNLPNNGQHLNLQQTQHQSPPGDQLNAAPQGPTWLQDNEQQVWIQHCEHLHQKGIPLNPMEKHHLQMGMEQRRMRQQQQQVMQSSEGPSSSNFAANGLHPHQQMPQNSNAANHGPNRQQELQRQHPSGGLQMNAANQGPQLQQQQQQQPRHPMQLPGSNFAMNGQYFPQMPQNSMGVYYGAPLQGWQGQQMAAAAHQPGGVPNADFLRHQNAQQQAPQAPGFPPNHGYPHHVPQQPAQPTRGIAPNNDLLSHWVNPLHQYPQVPPQRQPQMYQPTNEGKGQRRRQRKQ